MASKSFDAILELDLQFKESATAIFSALESAFDKTLDRLEKAAVTKFDEKFFDRIGQKLEKDLKERDLTFNVSTTEGSIGSVTSLDSKQLTQVMNGLQQSIKDLQSGVSELTTKFSEMASRGPTESKEGLVVLKNIQDRLGTFLSSSKSGAGVVSSKINDFLLSSSEDKRIQSFSATKGLKQSQIGFNKTMNEYFKGMMDLFPGMFSKSFSTLGKRALATQTLEARIKNTSNLQGETDKEKEMRVVRDFLAEAARATDANADFIKTLVTASDEVKKNFLNLETKRQETRDEYQGNKSDQQRQDIASISNAIGSLSNGLSTLFSKSPEELFNLRGILGAITDKLKDSNVAVAAYEQLKPMFAGVESVIKGATEEFMALLVPVAGPVAIIAGLLAGIIAVVTMALGRITEMNKALEASALQNVSGQGGDVGRGFDQARDHALAASHAIGDTLVTFDEVTAVFNTMAEVGLESRDISNAAMQDMVTHARLTGRAVSRIGELAKNLVNDQNIVLGSFTDQLYTVFSVTRMTGMGVGQFSEAVTSLIKTLGKSITDMGQLAITFANVARLTYLSNKSLIDAQEALAQFTSHVSPEQFSQLKGFLGPGKMREVLEQGFRATTEQAVKDIAQATGGSTVNAQAMIQAVVEQGRSISDVLRENSITGKNVQLVGDRLRELLQLNVSKRGYEEHGGNPAYGAQYFRGVSQNAQAEVISNVVQALLEKTGRQNMSREKALMELQNTFFSEAVLNSAGLSKEQAEKVLEIISGILSNTENIDINHISATLLPTLKQALPGSNKVIQNEMAGRVHVTTEGIMSALSSFLTTTVNQWSNYFSAISDAVNSLAGWDPRKFNIPYMLDRLIFGTPQAPNPEQQADTLHTAIQNFLNNDTAETRRALVNQYDQTPSVVVNQYMDRVNVYSRGGNVYDAVNRARSELGVQNGESGVPAVPAPLLEAENTNSAIFNSKFK